MKYIKTHEDFWPKIDEYVAVRDTSPRYVRAKNKIFQITLWNSEEYFLSDVLNLNNGVDIGWIKWIEVRHLNNRELKKLDLLQTVRKYNL
jgi:hypothetical protein